MKGSVLPNAAAGPKPVPRDDAERRQLTVMFCDLVGSSALSVRLDPEDLRRVIGAYHDCIAEVIARNQGIIARYMGDGVLAYFGYPQAHEDDAEQATRAGLALVDAVADLRTDIGTELQVRVGIATGTVVVGDLIGEGAAQEQAVDWRDAEPGCAPADLRRARYRADLPKYAPAHRWAFRIPRSRPCHAQGLGGTGTEPGRSSGRAEWKAASRRSTRPS